MAIGYKPYAAMVIADFQNEVTHLRAYLYIPAYQSNESNMSQVSHCRTVANTISSMGSFLVLFFLSQIFLLECDVLSKRQLLL